MSNDIWKFLSSAEGGFAAENPIEINKRMKEADYADPDKAEQWSLSQSQECERHKITQATGNETGFIANDRHV